MFDLDRIGGAHALDHLVDAVLEAGEIALRLYRGGAAARTERKPDRSPVTEADREVERHLRAYLDEAHPAAAFLGEESGEGAGTSDLRFVVDPIDGTRAFVRGIPTWSILLGLEAEGEPVLGVAYMPAAGDLFVGVQGHGATANGRPCRVSQVADAADAAIGHGALAQFTDEGMGPALERLAVGTDTQRGFADFANYRELLLGRLDAVVDPGVQPYDVCPAAVLVREAGGRFSDFGGAPTIHGRGFVASNGPVHDAILALLA
ncbi:MAG TPA: inositol monophosphatase family protein [Polyangiaceae bacterium LLY-WYZ-15_(1-7)]|nr:histidinol phosphate phosphatase [Myxococcales bacterium]MAT29170.1 histidinol phosphate phosphatase [Sandaracinus sp.]HJK95448.1 inositol monophosphatase family protein [Polyangiaceae bacterium LLY-WYZ-15_(1-7)]HJL03425.1 inositol monophosphatase family protein [Polyangiaceae bacterium LLY-WYZ-15_(1-7)]HJL13984.1 inositol monophosphatase family protein [Polyangiaceae bacterium LLY-WYZ-15_(1-7)]